MVCRSAGPWSGLQSQDWVSHSPTSDRRGSDLAARGLYQLVGRIHTPYSPGKAVFIPRRIPETVRWCLVLGLLIGGVSLAKPP